jgi:hypothetical protein
VRAERRGNPCGFRTALFAGYGLSPREVAIFAIRQFLLAASIVSTFALQSAVASENGSAGFNPDEFGPSDDLVDEADLLLEENLVVRGAAGEVVIAAGTSYADAAVILGELGYAAEDITIILLILL